MQFDLDSGVKALKDTIAQSCEPALERSKELAQIIIDATAGLPKLVSVDVKKPESLDRLLYGTTMPDSWLQLDKKIDEALGWWRDGLKTLAVHAHELEQAIEKAHRILICDDSPLKVWGKYGWTISPGALLEDYCVRPVSKEEADKIMADIHNDEAIQITFGELHKSDFHSEKDLKEIETLFAEGHYKACALLTFSLIDSLLIHTQDGSTYDQNRRPGGEEAINRYSKLAEPKDSQQFTTRALCFIACIAALQAFFDKTKNFQNSNPVLNRHLACHGMLRRDVDRTDCAQLILLYENMLHCMGNI